MIQMRFPNQPHLRYVNLGRAVDLRDKSLCWYGIHLTEEGNRRIAVALRYCVPSPRISLTRNPVLSSLRLSSRAE